MNFNLIERKRIYYLFYLITTVIVGLISRSSWFPSFLSAYLGDALYALMVFFAVAIVFKNKPTLFVAVLALSFCFAIEISQLYHAPFIDNIRHTRLGGLVLGFGFLWSDLLSYAVGVSVGWVTEKRLIFGKK